MRKLYFKCDSGISGDMTVAALLDAGADEEVLRRALASITPGEFDIDIHSLEKTGITALKFDVHAEEGHVHRHLSDIDNIIDSADMTDGAKKLAHKIFLIVAQAEAEAHGVDISEVHFHEVGAIDSIVDIISAAVCIDNIGIDEVIISDIAEGCGYADCAHGRLPVPVPAVLNIVKSHGLRIRQTSNDGEMITPTGAAIAAALRTQDKVSGSYRIISAGTGAGTKDFAQPNILRVMIIEEEEGVWELRSNIDDITGEAMGYTMELLFNKGALDVYFQPIYMKKNRPAYMLSVLCRENKIKELEELIFENTTTIGIRRHYCERTVLARRIVCKDTKYGKIKYKICHINDRERVYPEAESVKEAACRMGAGYTEMYEILCREYTAEEMKSWDRTEK